MSGFLLDTNVISELIKPIRNPGVLQWMGSNSPSALFLSVLTLGEIRKGIAGLPMGDRRTRLESWLVDQLSIRFRGRILPIDEAVADRWGRLQARAKELGRLLPTIDGLLGATAVHHNLILVTRNVKDLEFAGIECFNPWNTPQQT